MVHEGTALQQKHTFQIVSYRSFVKNLTVWKWKDKITNSNEYHKSYKITGKNRTNTDSWTFQRLDQVSRRCKHPLLTDNIQKQQWYEMPCQGKCRYNREPYKYYVEWHKSPSLGQYIFANHGFDFTPTLSNDNGENRREAPVGKRWRWGQCKRRFSSEWSWYFMLVVHGLEYLINLKRR